MTTSKTFKPFVTFDTDTQKMMYDSQKLSSSYEHSSTHFISLIEVKSSDLHVLTPICLPQPSSQNIHGIYISDAFMLPPKPLQDQSKSKSQALQNDKKIRLLYLPPNFGKVQERIQDLFASILLMLSNVSVFDISSKYMRSSSYHQAQKRCNYLTMHSAGGQLFKVDLQSATTKLELSSKIFVSQDQKQGNYEIIREIANNANVTYSEWLVKEVFEESQVFCNSHFFKNYLNYQQFRAKIFLNLKIHSYSHKNSKIFQQIRAQKTMQTKQQLEQVKDLINKFTITQQLQNWKPISNTTSNSSSSASLLSNNRYQNLCKILNKAKLALNDKIMKQNKDLKQLFLKEIKKQHFQCVESLSQLHIKKDMIEKIMKQYQIDQFYIATLTNEAQLNLQAKQIKKLSCVIYEKDQKIREMQQTIDEITEQKNSIQEQYEIAKDKICTFKHINGQFLRVTDDYDKERQKNRQSKIEIDSLNIKIQSLEDNQQLLRGIITRIDEEKKLSGEKIEQKNGKIEELLKKIRNLEEQIGQKDHRINEFACLQSKAWTAIEKAEYSQNEMLKLKKIAQQYQQLHKIFKKQEIKKFNYILKRNYQKHTKVLQQKEQIEKINTQYIEQINKLRRQLQQSKIHMKYCENQMLKVLRKGKIQDIYGVANQERELLEIS